MDLLKVGDYMNNHPVTFTPDMTVELAADRLTISNQTGGPVVDEHNKVIGFLSEQDCLALLLKAAYHDQQVAHVRDIMQAEVLSVKPYDGIIDLAQTMLKLKPKLYPVVDDNNHLLGIIGRSHVLAALDKEMNSHYRKAV
ncbi:MAG: CBS domain-containing protein [Alkalimonas sp.]|uniref:CBS domain-containing protein n=1 Tax=Alkalimonas delamerensis TaxID=265981 RepID=A0ABT9GP79_9GAMM|nr:CBS domain-containing protein [Alkalimonas delamerensis]MCC5852842.1 CBS domain-containing protein [Alkalimonas sp.]MDP4528783.1 CBS domain-containing protein [Alkalimonas delamerensis]